ncbi:helix-turn-helix transcriptional regulator [Pseudonocardia kujensis]|uniref:helix-turn-helix domain-containing protein n=1 Tax=Pseudonocardia kujensis TaxID=1128675 RepID=UPI001E47CBAF|nr:helix-turn-helix transcriptional regulator [Pseudonocardia kujensis]MCE0762066.1 helix-turn-helix transcriptional regulator [Pseudonocardia kujensis]
MVSDRDANSLGEYLRARRDAVTPDQVGLPVQATRRAPGLRREEVAMLAGISSDYYLRLERGRDRNPSPQVLQALARALRLDEVESEYLLGFTSPRPRRLRRRRTEPVPSRLHHLLAAVGVPAFVESRYFDVLASNPLAMALSPRLRPGENRLRSLLLDPEEREFHSDWEAAVADSVAWFRQAIGTDVEDARAVELVGELSLASARFRSLWARHDVRRLEGGTAVVEHPLVGPLRLHRDKLPVGEHLLVLYYPSERDEDAEKLRLLAALSAPGEVDTG